MEQAVVTRGRRLRIPEGKTVIGNSYGSGVVADPAPDLTDDVTSLEAEVATKADSDHHHDSDYAASGHNHDSAYAASGHDHDSDYAPIDDPTFTDKITIPDLWYQSTGGGVWTATAGAALGDNPGTIQTLSGEYHGRIIVTAGTDTTTGDAIEVTFEHARPTTGYAVFITPQSTTAAQMMMYVQTRLTTGFTIRARVAPTAGTNIDFDFMVVQR